MRKQVLLRIPKYIGSLVAIFIALVFSISVCTIEGNDEGLHSLGSQYLISESQDDVLDGDEASSSVIDTVIFPDIPEPQFVSDYLPEREVQLRVSPPVVSSGLNRAPPLEQ
jgi:hypothetical protein